MPGRLIEADALRESWLDWNPYEIIEANTVLESIDAAPTVDSVPVVRCRECKHCDPENYHCDHPMGTAAPLKRKPDDFCSYGERKDVDK